MFFQLLFIHLFRPFLKYNQQTSPLPHNVSPRKLCTQAAGMVSKLMRLYKRSHGLRQICNIVVYITHSACTIHLLNLPEKNARRDIVHGVKHLEEIADSWLAARRTLAILSFLARKWNVDLPEEASTVLARTDEKFASYVSELEKSSSSAPRGASEQMLNPAQLATRPASLDTSLTTGYFNNAPAMLNGGAGPVRKLSGTYSLPPSDANGILAAQLPSATGTPAPTAGHRYSGSRDSRRTSAASPSDMFGGVEQLLRDSQDWVLRDQAQFAMGFENWTGMDLDLNPSEWANGGMRHAPTTNGAGSGSAAASDGPVRATTSPIDTTNGIPNGGIANVANGHPVETWLTGTSPYNIAAGYNEKEWYY
jgi:hypothetical protein